MNSASTIETVRPAARQATRWRYWRGELKGSEYAWALAFVVPYIAVFLAFVAYPVVYGLWMGSEVRLYKELFADPVYQSTVVNTLLYLALAVNVKMVLALLLSGFFMRPGWWMQALLMIFVLPWAVPLQSGFISVHWMLNGEWGFLNNLLYTLFHIEGPSWLNERWLALGSAVVSHIWKQLPFWTIILLAGRIAIPLEILDTAKVDGATGLHSFVHVTLPLMAPALVAIGTYAFLLAWNEYLYQFLLLSSDRSMTVSVALARFLNSDVAPWNYMMATAIIYALPPVVLYYTCRGRMRAGLTVGGVKG